MDLKFQKHYEYNERSEQLCSATWDMDGLKGVITIIPTDDGRIERYVIKYLGETFVFIDKYEKDGKTLANRMILYPRYQLDYNGVEYQYTVDFFNKIKKYKLIDTSSRDIGCVCSFWELWFNVW
jgi:hypothetical protein